MDSQETKHVNSNWSCTGIAEVELCI